MRGQSDLQARVVGQLGCRELVVTPSSVRYFRMMEEEERVEISSLAVEGKGPFNASLALPRGEWLLNPEQDILPGMQRRPTNVSIYCRCQYSLSGSDFWV